MAQWKQLKYVKKRIIINMDGSINTGMPSFDIADNEASYHRNLGSQDYPAISVRPGRTFYSTQLGTVTTPNGIGERANSQLHILDGVHWKYWSSSSTALVTLSSSLSSTSGNILDFNTGSIRYTIMMNSTQKLYWDGASTSSTAYTLGDASTPLTKIFTVHKGRIYAASNATIYYCALNLINDWTTANDSGNITIARAKGDITGLCEYNDRVIAFTESGMHELYGDGPDTYDLIDIEGEVGCYSHRSIIKCNKRLYWYWNNAFYEYNGGSPLNISEPVKAYLKAITFANKDKVVSGSNGEILYISIPYSSSNNDIILVYDIRIGKWYVETGNFVNFVAMQNILYGIDSTGGIHNMRSTAFDDNGTAITWSFISKPFLEDSVSQKKVLEDISLIYKSTGTSFSISYSTSVSDNNSSSFTTLATSSDITLTGVESNTFFGLPTTDLYDENWYRIQFSGVGPASIYRMEKNYRVKRR